MPIDDVENAKLQMERRKLVVTSVMQFITAITVVGATAFYTSAQKTREADVAQAERDRATQVAQAERDRASERAEVDSKAAEVRAQNELSQRVADGKRQFLQTSVLPLATSSSPPVDMCKSVLATWIRLYGTDEVREIPVLQRCSELSSAGAAEVARFGVIAGYDTSQQAGDVEKIAVQKVLGDRAQVQVCAREDQKSFRTIVGPLASPADAEAVAIIVRSRVPYAQDAKVVNFKEYCPNIK